MYKITFVRLFSIENSFKVGYKGSHPDRGFFTKEFNTLEEAVKFLNILPVNIYVSKFHNFNRRDLRVLRYKKFGSRQTK